MKAKQKALKALNEAYLEQLDRVAELESLQPERAADPQQAEAELIAARSELAAIEVKLRAALKDAMRELGPVYKEIGRIIAETSGQTIEEFKAYCNRITGGTGLTANWGDTAKIAAKAAEVEKTLIETGLEIETHSSYLDKVDAFKKEEVRVEEMAAVTLDEIPRANQKLGGIQK